MSNLLWIGMVIVAAVSTIQATAVSPLPANIDVPRFLLEAVRGVYAQSDTFRAQCDRLGQAQNLRVTLHVDLQIPAVCRAFTIIQRKRGALCADVHLPAAAQVAELLGHEFEHIVEQLEHMNLRALSRVRGSGVHEVQFDLFETDRAERTGRIVAMEVLQRHERPGTD
jgi:hypothetical protein